MNVLLVTGSRSLVSARDAYAACASILSPLVSLATVVCGDADGPDDWAVGIARMLDQYCLIWSCNGGVYDAMGEIYRYSDSRVHPLDRNQAMVAACGVDLLAGDSVACVGFVDPASRTRGTDHTLRLARQAGIWCARYVWRGTEFVEES